MKSLNTVYLGLFASALLIMQALTPVHAAWIVREIKTGNQTQILSVQKTMRAGPSEPQQLQSLPAFLREDAPSPEIFTETLYNDASLPEKAERHFRLLEEQPQLIADSEVRTLVNQGPKQNRINLTILGDGYTLAEKEKFFEDAKRATDNLFTGSTFASYLPLFNVYAVFTPSRDSGISDGTRKNTAFGLYRDPPGSKRAIMPGNTSAMESALRLAPATDYPIVLANDEFYGGLGGRYAISTRSLESGMIVLRHELGHNFGNVGEEYDNGQVYSGANSSSSSQVKWSHWLSDGGLKVHESIILSGDYVWKNLKDSPYSAQFEFPRPTAGGDYQFEIKISSVGWSTPEDVVVELDGQRMTLEGKWTADRSFFSFNLQQSPAPGKHTLTVRQNLNDGDNVLAFAVIFAQPAGYDWAPDKIAAFATFDGSGNKYYRPTHDSCLMRNMLTPKFCSVDLENMWVRFLARVNLIDDLRLDRLTKNVELKTPELPGLEIRWFQLDEQGGETALSELNDQKSWSNMGQIKGRVRVKVKFRTAEVRKYNNRFEVQKDLSF